jgi:hypothetical protein
MPSAADSIAASFVSPMTPCLEAFYGVDSCDAMYPHTDAVLTIAPAR